MDEEQAPAPLDAQVNAKAACIRLKQGNGRPLALVHGSGTDSSRWAPVLPLLTRTFRVHTIDRRDHGSAVSSERREPYRIEQEFADLAALLADIGDDGTILVGHSYGALCALGAAAGGARLSGLVLYEPPLPASPEAYCPAGLPETMREAIDRNEPEEAAIAFATAIFGMSAAEADRRRRLGVWSAMAAGMPLALRELENVRRYAMGASRFAACAAPTLLLVGERSPAEYHATAQALTAALSNSRTVLLEGQGHGAVDAAPQLFARRVTEFIEASVAPYAG